MKTALSVYLACTKKASQDLLRNWPIIIGVILAYFLFMWVMTVSTPLGIAGGFLVGGVFVALLGQYYSWLQRTLGGSTLSFKDLVEFDSALFFQVMSVAFIFWIVLDLLLGSVSQGAGDNTARIVAQFAAVLVFNALPEILYIRRLESLDALSNCFQFVKDYWLEWFIPSLILLLVPFYFLSGEILLLLSSNSTPLLPFSPIFSAWSLMLRYTLALPDSLLLGIFSQLLPLLLCHWLMLFRGHLFEAIEHNRFRR